MSVGSKWRTTKPKQIQDPKLPIWCLHKERCQESSQQGGEEWKIHGTLLSSQQLGEVAPAMHSELYLLSNSDGVFLSLRFGYKRLKSYLHSHPLD